MQLTMPRAPTAEERGGVRAKVSPSPVWKTWA